MHPNGIRLSPGQRFGRFTVVAEDAERTAAGTVRWVVRCDCGAVRAVTGVSLRSGNSQSCGCWGRERASARNRERNAHRPVAMYKMPEYGIWEGMRKRCRKPQTAGFQNYGGRGIAVCERWQTFPAFLADMGPRPSPQHSIDRIDNNGPYSPENCRWATQTQQCRNTRANMHYTHAGITLTLPEWTERTGISFSTIRSRLRQGWSISRALTQPIQGRRKRTQG